MSEPLVGEWPDAEEHAFAGSPVEPIESVSNRATYHRRHVVAVLQAVECELAEDSRAYTRAADLELEELPNRTIGGILALLADSAATVAHEYCLPEARRVEVSRWGRSGNTTRWEVTWADA